MSRIKVVYLNKDIMVIRTNKAVTFPSNIAKEIDLYWQGLIREKPWFTRGKIYCVSEMKETDEHYVIELENSDYAHYLYGYNKNKKYLCKNCFAGVLMETNDNFYVLGETNNKTEVPGEIRFVGSGAIDADDFENNLPPTLNTAVRELYEEVGFDFNDTDNLKIMKGFYLITGGKRKSVGIIYIIHLNINREEVSKKFEKYLDNLKNKNEDPEFKKLFFVQKNKKSIEEDLVKSKKFIEYIPNVLYEDIRNTRS